MATALIHAVRIPARPNNGKGFPRIVRSFGYVGGVEVGQIDVSSGTANADIYVELLGMLRDLAERGDHASLIRIRDSAKRRKVRSVSGHKYEIHAVYSAWRKNRHVPSIVGLRSLRTALDEWRVVARKKTGEPLSDRTRESYRDNANQFFGFIEDVAGWKQIPTDADVPNLLAQYREYCVHEARQYYVPFNQVRTMLSSYARTTQPEGEDSALYKAIRKIHPLTTARKNERISLLPWEVLRIMKELPEQQAQHVWNMCALAVRPDEYASSRWEIVEHEDYGRYVVINGTKTTNAKRVIPLLDGVKPVRFNSTTFRGELTKLNKTMLGNLQGEGFPINSVLTAKDDA